MAVLKKQSLRPFTSQPHCSSYIRANVFAKAGLLLQACEGA
jgi:hypothetical protein